MTILGLEDRLRVHYRAKADELELVPLEFSDVLARDDAPSARMVSIPPTPVTRRGST